MFVLLFALFFLVDVFLASLRLKFFETYRTAKFRGGVCQLGFSLNFFENFFVNWLYAMLPLESQKKDEITTSRFFVQQIRFFLIIIIWHFIYNYFSRSFLIDFFFAF